MPQPEAIKQLFLDTQLAFQKSAIKKYADANNLKWNYAISSTQLRPKANLIVGFNWGVAANEEYTSQNEIPMETFKDLYEKNWLDSLQRIYHPLKRYLPDDNIDHCVQTNFCFFRSKSEAQIKLVDLKLSTPLFTQLLELIEPKRIIGFSSKLRNHFISHELLTNIQEKRIPSNTRSIHVVKGTFKAATGFIPVYFLPHPNAKFTGEAREEAWAFCFK